MKRILVIDDEIQMCRLIDIALRSHFALTTANDGASGFKAAMSMQPDLILCDVNMTGIDGYQTLHLLRDHPETRATPCILMTGQGSETGMRRGMALGADDYLRKPFDVQELRATVDARITRQKWFKEEAEEKFQHLQETLATSIPDQLLGPLDGLIGLTELIGKCYREFEFHEIVTMARDVHRTGLRVRQQVENCLLFAELLLLAEEPNRTSPWRARSAVHVLDVVEPTTLEMARQHERVADVRASMNYCQAQVPERSLRKIIQEVLDNAFKFSPRSSPVEVRVFPLVNECVIEIVDRGPGITNAQLAKLDAFVRFEQKLLEAKGCGLGLAIAKRLTQLNGGRLSLRTRGDGGTVTQIVLPSVVRSRSDGR